MFARSEFVCKMMRSMPDEKIWASAWARKFFGGALDRWLAHAVEGFDYPSFKCALMLGADPRIKASIGTDYPLATRIARSDEPDFLRTLLRFGADLRAGESVGGYLPIHMAASKGAVRTLAVLIECGADVGERYVYAQAPEPQASPARWSALIIACRQSKPEAIALLLAAGANPHDQDGQGASALEICVKGRCMDGAKLIREAMSQLNDATPSQVCR